MTICTICGSGCPGMPDAGTAFCEDCYMLNLDGNPLDVSGCAARHPGADILQYATRAEEMTRECRVARF